MHWRPLLNRTRETVDMWLFRRRLRRAGLGHSLNIRSYTRPDELAVLNGLAGSVPENGRALEIGAFLGASACVIGAALVGRHARLFCVDTWKNERMPEAEADTLEEFLRNTRSIHDVLVPIRKHSHSLTREDVETPLHLIFIDGDHNYAGVRRDVEIVNPWLAPDGLLVFHDSTAFEGVSRTIGDLLKAGTFKLGGHHRNLTWLLRADWPSAPDSHL